MTGKRAALAICCRWIRQWGPIVVLIIAAAGLRYPGLDRELWFDEVYQIYMASGRTCGEIMERVAEDRNPPLSHFFTRVGFWLTPTELGARLPSLIAGLCCVAAAYAAGLVWSGRTAGLWAAGFVACSPVFNYYSRDARPYSLGACALFAFLSAAGSFRLRATPAHGLGLAVAAAAAASFQYAGIVVVMIGLLLLWRVAGPNRPDFRAGVLIAGAIAGALSAVWIVGFALPQFSQRGGGLNDAPFASNFFDPRDAASTSQFFGTQIGAFFAFPFLGAPLGPRWTAVCLATSGTCLAATALAARRSGRYRFLIHYLISSIAVFLILAAAGKHPFGGLRHCMPLHPILFLVLAAGVQQLGRRSTAVGFVIGGLLVLLMLYGDAKVLPMKHYCSLRGLFASLHQEYRSGDPVLVKGPGAATVIGHYYLRDFPWLGPATILGLAPGASKAPGPSFDEAIAEALRAGPRVWVIEMFDQVESPPPAPIPGAIVRDVIRGVRIDAVLYESLRESPSGDPVHEHGR